jgi:hypothetical protein
MLADFGKIRINYARKCAIGGKNKWAGGAQAINIFTRAHTRVFATHPTYIYILKPGFSLGIYLQTLNTISAEKNSTIVFPLPIDLLTYFMRARGGGGGGGCGCGCNARAPPLAPSKETKGEKDTLA